MICHKCKHYNTRINDCGLEDGDATIEWCPHFVALKACPYRVEHCVNEQCTSLCCREPHEKGCPFTWSCSHDNTHCDEDCQKHEHRKYAQWLEAMCTTVQELESTIEDLNRDLSEFKRAFEEGRTK